MFKGIRIKYCIVAVLSSAFLAFGLYHVHSLSGVTEGGVIGLNLLLDHWFHISPSITNFIANVICYALGWKLLGRKFIIYSAVATVSFSVSYSIFEQFEPLWPQLGNAPLLASIIGAVFVGIGAGLCVKVGGAVSGDDALAMCVSHVFHMRVEWAYLVSDITVYNGPRELDHGIEKMREHGIMRLSKGRSANHVIQNVHVGIQGEGSH